MRVGIDPGGVQLAINRLEGAAGAEKQVFAVRIENRLVLVVIPAGHLVALAFPEVVENDRCLQVVLIPRISQPAAIGRPTESGMLQIRMVAASFLIDLDGLLAVQVMQVNFHRLVDENDLLAVRRPAGPVAVPGAEFRQDGLLAGAVRGTDG